MTANRLEMGVQLKHFFFFFFFKSQEFIGHIKKKPALYDNKSSHICHQWHSRFCKMLHQLKFVTLVHPTVRESSVVRALVFTTTGQVGVQRAHSEQAVVAHALHGHRYRPSTVPLTGTWFTTASIWGLYFYWGIPCHRIDPSWGRPIELFNVPASASHDWCNKGPGMLSCLWDCAYKRTLAVNWKVSHVATAGFLSLSEWSSTMCPTPINPK